MNTLDNFFKYLEADESPKSLKIDLANVGLGVLDVQNNLEKNFIFAEYAQGNGKAELSAISALNDSNKAVFVYNKSQNINTVKGAKGAIIPNTVAIQKTLISVISSKYREEKNFIWISDVTKISNVKATEETIINNVKNIVARNSNIMKIAPTVKDKTKVDDSKNTLLTLNFTQKQTVLAKRVLEKTLSNSLNSFKKIIKLKSVSLVKVESLKEALLNNALSSKEIEGDKDTGDQEIFFRVDGNYSPKVDKSKEKNPVKDAGQNNSTGSNVDNTIDDEASNNSTTSGEEKFDDMTQGDQIRVINNVNAGLERIAREDQSKIINKDLLLQEAANALREGNIDKVVGLFEEKAPKTLESFTEKIKKAFSKPIKVHYGDYVYKFNYELYREPKLKEDGSFDFVVKVTKDAGKTGVLAKAKTVANVAKKVVNTAGSAAGAVLNPQR